MQNFYYDIPTEVAFGKGEIKRPPEFVKEFGQKVLIVYGGGSIKRTGLYDTVVNLLLDENGISYVELSGAEPNPRVTTVQKGVDFCKEHDVQVVLPIGGGSTIDCAKVIAAAYYFDGEPWNLQILYVLLELKIRIILTNLAIIIGTLGAVGLHKAKFQAQ